MDNASLVAGVVLVWSVLVAATWRRVSLTPIFPALPTILLVLGFLLNAWIPWAGTIAVGVLHVVGVAVVIVRDKRSARSTKSPDDMDERPR